MQLDPTQRSAPINIPYAIALVEETRWTRVWDGLPTQGQIVPVWDGDYLYYATFWEKEGAQMWVISHHISNDLTDFDMRKKPGEQVYPIQWLKISVPTS